MANDSVFNMPENRDGTIKNLGIPSNITRNNQTTQTDFDVYYNMTQSFYTSDAVNKAFTYRAARDIYEFRDTYSDLLKAMANENMLISMRNNETIQAAIDKAHDQNTDNMIYGHLGIKAPKIVIASNKDSDSEIARGVMLSLSTPDGRNYVTFERVDPSDYTINLTKNEKFDSNNINIVKGLFLDSKYLLNFKSFLDQFVVVEDLVLRDELFEKDSNKLKKDHIIYIDNELLNLEDGSIKNHINDTILHTTIEDKNKWDAKYNKPIGGIPLIDLETAIEHRLDQATDHMNDNSKHVSEYDRNNWNNKFTMPSGLLTERHFSVSVNDRLDTIFSITEILDINTNKLKYELLPDHDHSDMNILEAIDNHLEQYIHHPNDMKIFEELHLAEGEREKWNAKYDKPDGGIPFDHLASGITDKFEGIMYESKYVDEEKEKIKDKYLQLLDNKGQIKLEYLDNVFDIYAGGAGRDLKKEFLTKYYDRYEIDDMLFHLNKDVRDALNEIALLVDKINSFPIDDIASIGKRLDEIEDLVNGMVDNNNAISSLKDRVTKLETQVGDINNSVTEKFDYLLNEDNGVITKLKKDVTNLQGNVSNLQTSVTQLYTTVKTNTTDIESLKEEDKKINDRISAHENDLNLHLSPEQNELIDKLVTDITNDVGDVPGAENKNLLGIIKYLLTEVTSLRGIVDKINDETLIKVKPNSVNPNN